MKFANIENEKNTRFFFLITSYPGVSTDHKEPAFKAFNCNGYSENLVKVSLNINRLLSILI